MCGEVKKGNNSSTGNFKSHYELKHESEYKKLEIYLKESIVPSVTKKMNHQPAINTALQIVSNDTVSYLETQYLYI